MFFIKVNFDKEAFNKNVQQAKEVGSILGIAAKQLAKTGVAITKEATKQIKEEFKPLNK